MPEDTKFIGLLSNPVSHFKRLWNKYDSFWSIKSGLRNDTVGSTNATHLGIQEMKTFLTDPWKYLSDPLEQYREAELLKNHKILHNTLTDYQPKISSLIHTRNPQVYTLTYTLKISKPKKR